jgi:hypothetical protein
MSRKSIGVNRRLHKLALSIRPQPGSMSGLGIRHQTFRTVYVPSRRSSDSKRESRRKTDGRGRHRKIACPLTRYGEQLLRLPVAF